MASGISLSLSLSDWLSYKGHNNNPYVNCHAKDYNTQQARGAPVGVSGQNSQSGRKKKNVEWTFLFFVFFLPANRVQKGNLSFRRADLIR